MRRGNSALTFFIFFPSLRRSVTGQGCETSLPKPIDFQAPNAKWCGAGSKSSSSGLLMLLVESAEVEER